MLFIVLWMKVVALVHYCRNWNKNIRKRKPRRTQVSVAVVYPSYTPYHYCFLANPHGVLSIFCPSLSSNMIWLSAATLLRDHAWQVLSTFLHREWMREYKNNIPSRSLPEFGPISARKPLYSLLAVRCLLYAVLTETKHVVWQAHSFVLPPDPYFAQSFCIPSLPQNASSLLTWEAILKHCCNVAADSCRCYFGGDYFFSVIIQRWRFSWTISVRCESTIDCLMNSFS